MKGLIETAAVAAAFARALRGFRYDDPYPPADRVNLARLAIDFDDVPLDD